MYKSIEKLFKYGSFREEETHSFETLKELEDHLSEVKEQEYIPSSDYEEYQSKWKLEVSASNGTMFTIDIDL